MTGPTTGTPAATALSGADHRLPTFCVAAGVWATAIPFPSVLGYSYSYTVRVPDGVLVVDLGWDSDAAWQAFVDGLARARIELGDVIGAVITHAHPDHYGLAARLRSTTSAWIATHEAEAGQLAEPGSRDAQMHRMTQWLARCGVPDDNTAMDDEISRLVRAMPSVRPDRLLVDGQVVPGTAGALETIHTPGHSAGHLCFRDRSRGLLFSGDHLLPKTRTNVASRPGNTADPAGDFVASLRKLADTVDERTVVLPGHEWPFDFVADRIQSLDQRHRRRSTEVLTVVGDGAHTVWQVARRLIWSRPFDAFTAHAQRQVLGETYAHLVHLAKVGRLAMRTPIGNDAVTWWAADHGAVDTGAVDTAAVDTATHAASGAAWAAVDSPGIAQAAI